MRIPRSPVRAPATPRSDIVARNAEQYRHLRERVEPSADADALVVMLTRLLSDHANAANAAREALADETITIKPPVRCVKCGASMRFDWDSDPKSACKRWDDTKTCACTRGDDECGCEYPSRTRSEPHTDKPSTFTSTRPTPEGPYEAQRGMIDQSRIPAYGLVALCRAPCLTHRHDPGPTDGTWLVRVEPTYALAQAADAACLTGDTACANEIEARQTFDEARAWLQTTATREDIEAAREDYREPDIDSMILQATAQPDSHGNVGDAALAALAHWLKR